MRHILIPLLVITLGCSGTGQSGRSSQSSTEDFDVTIDQVNAPPVMRGQSGSDVHFAVMVKNRTLEPWTIDRIALQTMGSGSYLMPVQTRSYNGRVVTPGAEESFEFWATVEVPDDLIGTKGAVTLRATLYAKNDGATRQEEFMQRINGRIAVATSK